MGVHSDNETSDAVKTSNYLGVLLWEWCIIPCYMFQYTMYVFTTLNTPTGSPPPPVHLTHYTHSSLNHKTCTSRGPSPSATNREQSIIPLKQLQKNYTQSKYLFVIWHQEQVYHKNINQPANWVGPIVSPHYHVRMHEWMIKKERKCILQFVCTYSRM